MANTANTASSTEIVRRAGDFLRASGRDIDIAIYEHAFAGGPLEAVAEALAGYQNADAGGPLEAVAEALAGYQNADGGFRGLEVDIAAPVSNPFAMALALTICQQVGMPKEHAVLQGAVRWLEETQDEEGNWRFAPEVYKYELAPWFQGWEWPNLNPSCPLEGSLRLLGLGSAQLHARVDQLFDRLANVRDLVSDEFYGIGPYVGYLLPEGTHPQHDLYRWGIVWWLIRQAGNAELDGNHFFQFVPTPQSYTARALPADIIGDRLDRLQAEQQDDGGWPTPYDPRWRGWVTMQNLLTLKSFGRV